MLNILNSRIALSGATIVAAGALIAGATFAFFSDSETSQNNLFQAGEIDLKIDNESYAVDYNVPSVENPTGVLMLNPNTSWELSDLTVQKFFNFDDLKPGDYGEDTISVHVETNNAWLCAAARITTDLDNSFTEPEDEVNGPIDSTDGTVDGDLDSAVRFSFWKDDGDNVLEVGETAFLSGPVSALNGAGQIALSDTTVNSVYGQNVPIPGNTTAYIGKAWCYGTMTPTAVAQDGLGKTGTNGPLVRGTGFTCDGSAEGNIGQTDSLTGDLQFYAVQSRNNPNFTCSQNYTPVWPTVTPTP